MNTNAELLNYIYQNSQMGVETLGQLLEITEDEIFREVLKKQQEEYWKFYKKAGDMLNKNGFDEKGLNTFEKIRTYLMITGKTMKDHSVSAIAEMLINGSTMGIIEAQKKLHQYVGEAEKDICDLMESLKKAEEENVEKLKKYL